MIVIFFLAFLFNVNSAYAAQEAASSAGLNQNKTDERIKKLTGFLKAYNSPLKSYAAVFIQNADKYNLDWKLIPAITGVESTFGKFIPYDSYNAYGWANGKYTFNSWEESIEVVSKALKQNYIDKGLNTIEKISPVYCPPNPTWGWKVKYFMEKLENFTPASASNLELSL